MPDQPRPVYTNEIISNALRDAAGYAERATRIARGGQATDPIAAANRAEQASRTVLNLTQALVALESL